MSPLKKCNYCGSLTKKNGCQTNGKQRIKCLSKLCGKHMQIDYTYKAKKPEVWLLFSKFNQVNIPIRKLAKFLEINEKTVAKWIQKALAIQPYYDFKSGCDYDIDELRSYIGQRKMGLVHICYGWNIDYKKPVGLVVGGCSSEDLEPVTKLVTSFSPNKVTTDGLSTYKKLLKKVPHTVGKHAANNIERQHVNLRKDMSNLSRKTICFARSINMLKARIMWYFWGNQDPLFFLKESTFLQ